MSIDIPSVSFPDSRHVRLYESASQPGAVVVKLSGYSGDRVIDPQALVDALAELFPDVKPSPPKPKVGDWVQERVLPNVKPAPVGELIAAGSSLGIVRFDSGSEGALWLTDLTVIERGES